MRELSETQDIYKAMIYKYKQTETPQEPKKPKKQAYNFKIEQSPARPLNLDSAQNPVEKFPNISDSQDLAAAMIKQVRQKDEGRKIKVQEAQKQATEQTKPANDNQAQKYYNPVTGQEMTAENISNCKIF